MPSAVSVASWPRSPSLGASPFLSGDLEGGRGRRGRESERLERDIPPSGALCGRSRRIASFVNGICLFTSQATSQAFCKPYKQRLAGC